MFFIGIDWAHDHHDISIVNESGQQNKQFRISEDSDGFFNLLKEVQALKADPRELLFALEKSHGLLVDFLLSHGFTVYPINPKSAERMRDRHSASMKKDDSLDAFVLADALRTDRHRLTPLVPDSELARELKVLVSDREHLVRLKTRTVNQMNGCLREYYPLGLEIFCSLQSETTLDFLKCYPTPRSLKQMNLDEFSQFLKERNYPFKTFKKTPESFYEQIQSSPLLIFPNEVVEKTKSRFLIVLIDQLRTLIHQVKEYDQAIAELMQRHPDNDLFSSLPGGGKTLSAKLAAHFGEDRDRFKQFESVQRLAGTAPVTQASGNFIHVKMRRACQESFRETLTQYAFVTLRTSLWAKRYYEEKRKSGKTHAGAIRALANKWAKIIYALWKKRECYQEQIFLAAKQQQAFLNAS